MHGSEKIIFKLYGYILEIGEDIKNASSKS